MFPRRASFRPVWERNKTVDLPEDNKQKLFLWRKKTRGSSWVSIKVMTQSDAAAVVPVRLRECPNEDASPLKAFICTICLNDLIRHVRLLVYCRDAQELSSLPPSTTAYILNILQYLFLGKSSVPFIQFSENLSIPWWATHHLRADLNDFLWFLPLFLSPNLPNLLVS